MSDDLCPNLEFPTPLLCNIVQLSIQYINMHVLRRACMHMRSICSSVCRPHKSHSYLSMILLCPCHGKMGHSAGLARPLVLAAAP